MRMNVNLRRCFHHLPLWMKGSIYLSKSGSIYLIAVDSPLPNPRQPGRSIVIHGSMEEGRKKEGHAHDSLHVLSFWIADDLWDELEQPSSVERSQIRGICAWKEDGKAKIIGWLCQVDLDLPTKRDSADKRGRARLLRALPNRLSNQIDQVVQTQLLCDCGKFLVGRRQIATGHFAADKLRFQSQQGVFPDFSRHS